MIYPNPSKGFIELKGDESLVKQITIYDNVGRLIQQLNKDISKKIDFTGLADGVYQLKIETKNDSFNQKIIIKK